jgi:hypothetical protein
LPAAVCFEEGVCGDDEFSHDGCDGDFGGLSSFDELDTRNNRSFDDVIGRGAA